MRRARVHLKIDTGMERIGVHWYSADALLERALRCTHTHVEGIFSHFANSDAPDLTHARLQLERFEEALEREKMQGQLRMLNFACAAKARRRTLTLTRPSRYVVYG